MRPFNGCIDSDMKKAILTSISLIVAVCGILIARRVFMPKHVKSASNETSAAIMEPTLKEWINNSIDEDCPPGDLLRYHPEWVSDAERAQLESVWAAAATNLLNGDVRGMKVCVATVSERMKGISAGHYYDIVRPCATALSREFKGGILSRSYATPEEFKACVIDGIEGMNFLGDIERSAVLVPRQGAYFEADALAMIRRCVQKFTDDGRADFVLVAKELEETIINQIESENGLTRRYMNADLKGQMLLYERGYSTRENVIRGVRTDAWYLENTAGYIPKWLEEFK